MMDIDLKQLREVMRALKQFGVQELEMTRGDEKIFLRREASTNGDGMSPHLGDLRTTPPPPKPTSPPEARADDSDSLLVRSPLVGTFYEAPSPDADSFVKIGQEVQAGHVLCIVEAMKLMNEIEA